MPLAPPRAVLGYQKSGQHFGGQSRGGIERLKDNPYKTLAGVETKVDVNFKRLAVDRQWQHNGKRLPVRRDGNQRVAETKFGEVESPPIEVCCELIGDLVSLGWGGCWIFGFRFAARAKVFIVDSVLQH